MTPTTTNSEALLTTLGGYLKLIACHEDTVVLFMMSDGSNMDKDLMSAFGKCSFKGHKSRLVVISGSEPYKNCDIMDYAGIDHLPVVFFFKNGVLKARVLGFEAIMKLVQQAKLELIKERGQFGPLANKLVFHFMNAMTLQSFAVNLRDLWHAQGFSVIVRRNTKK